jgi:outer membrane lipoprotein SlyB
MPQLLRNQCLYRPAAAVLGVILLIEPGCATKTGTGALVGGAGGAAVGGIIGSMSHARAGEGMLIGGAVGALGGALVGASMDEQDRQDSYSKNYDEHFDQYGHRKD